MVKMAHPSVKGAHNHSPIETAAIYYYCHVNCRAIMYSTWHFTYPYVYSDCTSLSFFLCNFSNVVHVWTTQCSWQMKIWICNTNEMTGKTHCHFFFVILVMLFMFGLHSAPGRWKYEYATPMKWQGKPTVLGEKPVPVLFCPQQIAQAILWDEICALTVSSLW